MTTAPTPARSHAAGTHGWDGDGIMSETTFAVGDRVWVSAAGTDGGDAGYATLIAIRENGTCDLRDDNGAEYWSLLSHLTLTQPPAPTEATAREIAVRAWTIYCDDDRCGTDADYDAFIDAVESALAARQPEGTDHDAHP